MQFLSVVCKNWVGCSQGGRSCAKARRAFAKKFGLEGKFQTLTYAIYAKLSRYYDLLQFTHFLEDVGQKKCSFWSKTVFPGQKVPYYMVYIAYYNGMKLQICNYAQKRRICKYTPDENFCGHFCPRRKAANFCHPASL